MYYINHYRDAARYNQTDICDDYEPIMYNTTFHIMLKRQHE